MFNLQLCNHQLKVDLFWCRMITAFSLWIKLIDFFTKKCLFTTALTRTRQNGQSKWANVCPHTPYPCSWKHDARFSCITHKQEPGLKTASARGANYSGAKYVGTTKSSRCRYSVIRAQHCYIAGARWRLRCALGKFYFHLKPAVRIPCFPAKQNRGGRIADITGSRFISPRAIRSGMREPLRLLYMKYGRGSRAAWAMTRPRRVCLGNGVSGASAAFPAPHRTVGVINRRDR